MDAACEALLPLRKMPLLRLLGRRLARQRRVPQLRRGELTERERIEGKEVMRRKRNGVKRRGSAFELRFAVLLSSC